MKYLPREYENTQDILAFNAVNSDGMLYNPASVKFRIINADGDVVFPDVGYEDVTSAGLGTGRFWATDVSEGIGWTPDAAEVLGKATVEWVWKPEAGDPDQVWRDEFYIEDQTKFSGIPYASYLAPTEFRNEGLDETFVTDARLETLIDLANGYIDDTTGLFFRPCYLDVRLDGPGSDKLMLSMPILGIEAVYRNNSTVADGTTANRINYAPSTSRRGVRTRRPDPRNNPWISARRDSSNLYAMAGRDRSTKAFSVGDLNQRVAGVFGYVDPEGTAPALIKRAAFLLAYLNADLPSEEVTVGPAGPVVGYSVEGHSEQYASSGATTVTTLVTSGNREVEEILRRYRQPATIAAPRSRWRM